MQLCRRCGCWERCLLGSEKGSRGWREEESGHERLKRRLKPQLCSSGVTREMLLRGLMVACEQQRSRTLELCPGTGTPAPTAVNNLERRPHACPPGLPRMPITLFTPQASRTHSIVCSLAHHGPSFGVEALTSRVRAPCRRRRSAEQRVVAACQEASLTCTQTLPGQRRPGRTLHCRPYSSSCAVQQRPSALRCAQLVRPPHLPIARWAALHTVGSRARSSRPMRRL